MVDSIAVSQFFIDVDSPDDPDLNRLGSPEPDSLEYGPLGGDSGGGVIAIVDGAPLLVGVNGSVRFTLEHVSDHGWYGLPVRLTAVAPAREWIESVIGGG